MPVPGAWLAFVQTFDIESFWYLPHVTVDGPELVDTLNVFSEFEDVIWNDDDVIDRFHEEGLSDGVTAGPRITRKALENLGLCWLDDHHLRITPAGHALINGQERSKLLEGILWKYHLPNPVNPTPQVALFPHAALIRMLLQLDGKITRDEFILFAGRTATDDVTDSIALINRWRQLNPAAQDAIIAALGKKFRTLQTAQGYCQSFHRCASYLRKFKDVRRRQGIELIPARRDYAQALLNRHDETAHIIEYASVPDYIAALGSADPDEILENDVDYYLETSQVEKAVEAFQRLPVSARGGRTVAEFREEAFLEKHLEDYLENRLGLIEPGLVREGQGRQHGTAVGPIDLFARAENGDLVVIELKKARASDKVFGQLCRYMGCITSHYAEGNTPVRGYIIGSEIDQKLEYAAIVVGQPKVRLKKFRRDVGNPEIFIEDT